MYTINKTLAGVIAVLPLTRKGRPILDKNGRYTPRTDDDPGLMLGQVAAELLKAGADVERPILLLGPMPNYAKKFLASQLFQNFDVVVVDVSCLGKTSSEVILSKTPRILEGVIIYDLGFFVCPINYPVCTLGLDSATDELIINSQRHWNDSYSSEFSFTDLNWHNKMPRW